MEDDNYEHKTIDEVLESEQKKKKKQKLLEKVRIYSSLISSSAGHLMTSCLIEVLMFMLPIFKGLI